MLGLEGQSKMRTFLVAFTALTLAFAGAAQAKVAITVDKDNQQMTVAVDGVERYRWPVSTGIPSYETPNGSFRAFRMEEDHYSKEFDDAPMPHSIFFTKIGHAIHGTDSVNRLGSPASHGCVRLSREHAATLYALVQEQGVLNATVTLTGSSQVALARNPKRGNTAVARRAPQYEQQFGDAAGDPVMITPQQQQQMPQARADDGYIDRPTAAPMRRCIRRRAAAASTIRRPIIANRNNRSNIPTATRRRRKAITIRRGRAGSSLTRTDQRRVGRHDRAGWLRHPALFLLRPISMPNLCLCANASHSPETPLYANAILHVRIVHDPHQHACVSPN